MKSRDGTGCAHFVKLKRRCPRCHLTLYHFAHRHYTRRAGTVLEGVHVVEIDCADCGHRWRGTFRRREWSDD